MSEITQQMVEESYEIAKKVHKKELSKNKGAEHLKEKYGMNKYSALIYISDIICMLNGQEYKRQMAKNHTFYYLTKIKEDFGSEYFIKSFLAVKRHINYEHSIEHPSNVEKLYNSIVQELLNAKETEK
ncbi:hypothetical protein R83H12_00540 [Fibrobacteria bacterium R8-3-H12]